MSTMPVPSDGSVTGPVTGPSGRGVGGGWIVGLLVAVGFAAATTGVLFQRHQTKRCLAFYGPDAARRITLAPRVALLRVRPAGADHHLETLERTDVSRAAGLVHLRRGLVEDANFSWQGGPAAAPLALDAWDVALEFDDPASGRTTLVIDLDGDRGSLAVVGAPGRVGLGRLGRGLATWVRAATAAPGGTAR